MWKINFQVNNQDVTIQTFLFQFAENHENCKKEFMLTFLLPPLTVNRVCNHLNFSIMATPNATVQLKHKQCIHYKFLPPLLTPFALI